MVSPRALLPLLAAGLLGAADHPIDRAFLRLYNFDFAGSHRILNGYLGSNPSDPLGHGVIASTILFEELARLEILQGEFFAEDKRIIAKKKLAADPARREQFLAAIAESQQRAKDTLESQPNDANALFALTLAAGLTADYMALIEKRQWSSLTHVKQANSHAVELLKKHPSFADAYLTTGFSEYVVGSLPFFLRWFVKLDGVEGNKDRAAAKLERVVRSGRYLGPFAKILLAVYHIREKKPQRAKSLMAELSRDFPENPLFRAELAKLESPGR